MTKKKNQNEPSEAYIGVGIVRIRRELEKFGLSCDEGEIGYERLYTDDTGETQGGWYAVFDTKSRNKLRECAQVSWRNIGMVGGDTLEEILKTIEGLRFRNQAKEPTALQLKMAENIQNKVDATKQALEVYNSAQPLSDSDLRLCIAHFKELDRLIKTDPMLALVRPYVNQHLFTLEGYKEARKRK